MREPIVPSVSGAKRPRTPKRQGTRIVGSDFMVDADDLSARLDPFESGSNLAEKTPKNPKKSSS